jgi:hypothetical protein
MQREETEEEEEVRAPDENNAKLLASTGSFGFGVSPQPQLTHCS